MSKRPVWGWLYSLLLLGSCSPIQFRSLPQVCYPDFKMTLQSFRPDPEVLEKTRDSLEVIHKSGWVYIKEKGSPYCLGQYVVAACDLDNQTVTLRDDRTAPEIDPAPYLYHPIYVHWNIEMDGQGVSCRLTSLDDSTFVEKTAGQMVFLKPKKSNPTRAEFRKCCKKRKY